MNPVEFMEKSYRVNLESQVDETIQQLTKLAIAENSNRLLDKCYDLRAALQDLLAAYESNGNPRLSTNTLNKNKNEFIRKTNSIRRLVTFWQAI